MSLKAAIIGMGNIAAFIDNPKSDMIASHTKAYLKCKETHLSDAFEPDPHQRQAFEDRWGKGVVFHPDIQTLLSQNIDILSIASPTPFHFETLQQTLNSSVKYLLCEKPVVSSLAELDMIENALLSSSKQILINIIREYNPIYQKIAKDLSSFGKPITFFGTCTKGLLHNGIHLLALIEQFIAPITSIQKVQTKCKKNDISGDFYIQTASCSGSIVVFDAVDYSEFCLTIWFKNGKLIFQNSGDELLLFTKEASKFEGYNSLKLIKHYSGLLHHYALDSLQFLLGIDQANSKTILKKHLDLHRKIFEFIDKECP